MSVAVMTFVGALTTSRRPVLVLYARDGDREIALVRWPTTIGTWQLEKRDDGGLVTRYESSPPGAVSVARGRRRSGLVRATVDAGPRAGLAHVPVRVLDGRILGSARAPIADVFVPPGDEPSPRPYCVKHSRVWAIIGQSPPDGRTRGRGNPLACAALISVSATVRTQ